MYKKLFAVLFLFAFANTLFAKKGKDSLDIILEQRIKFMDSVDNAMQWQTGSVSINNGIIKLNVPKEFKYLNAKQSEYIIHKVWGNPERNDVLGMLFPSDGGPFADSSYAFIITYEESGYVSDADADKIDYTAMLHDLQDQEKEENKHRATEGYDPIHMLGWASPPYYDKTNRVLHWAKELKFGDDSIFTLNYEVRVLGRKGVLSMNAVATMDELQTVKASIDKVLQIPQFTQGNRYIDFDSKTDKVAAYGIGALVAGGVLAKTGVLALIGKFFLAAWKFILIGLAAAWGAIKKFFTGKSKKKEDDYQDRVEDYKP